MAYPAPDFDFQNGRSQPVRCYLPSEGRPGALTDLMGSGDPLVYGTSVSRLLPTGTPSGRACLSMSGGSLSNAGTAVTLDRQIFWYAMLARLTATGQVLRFGPGPAATLSVSGQTQALAVGGNTAISNCSPGQWGVYFGYVSPAVASILPFFQGYNFAGAAAPSSSTFTGSVTVPTTFAGDFGGLMYGPLASTVDYFLYPEIEQVQRYFCQYGVYSPASPVALVESNSIAGEITVAGAAACWPAQMQTLLGTGGQVVNLACSSAYLDKMALIDRVRAAYDPTRQQVLHFAEGNNGLLFGTYAGDGAGLYAAEMAHLAAIKAACPRLQIVHHGPPTRNAVASGGNQTTFNAARAAYLAARDAQIGGSAVAGDSYTYLPDTGLNATVALFVKGDQMPGFGAYTSSSFQGDETHLSAVGHGHMAASAAFAQQYLTRRADRLALTYLDAAVSTRSTYAGADTAGTTSLLGRLTADRAAGLDALPGLAADVNAALLGPRAVAGALLQHRTEAGALRFSAPLPGADGSFAGVTRP